MIYKELGPLVSRFQMGLFVQVKPVWYRSAPTPRGDNEGRIALRGVKEHAYWSLQFSGELDNNDVVALGGVGSLGFSIGSAWISLSIERVWISWRSRRIS